MVNDADEVDFTFLSKIAIDTRVVAPEGAHAHDGNTDFFFSRQSSVLGLQEKRL